MPSNVVQRNHIGIDGLGVYIGVILVHAGKQVEPCIDGLLVLAAGTGGAPHGRIEHHANHEMIFPLVLSLRGIRKENNNR